MSKQLLDQPVDHPFIAFLVRMVQNIVDAMAFGNYEVVLRGMLMVFNSLRPDHKNNERGQHFKEKLMKVYELRGTPTHPTHSMFDPVDNWRTTSTRDGENYLAYHDLFDELQDIIWTSGYYNFEFYQKAIPSAGDNISGSKPQPGLPGILSSRIQG